MRVYIFGFINRILKLLTITEHVQRNEVNPRLAELGSICCLVNCNDLLQQQNNVLDSQVYSFKVNAPLFSLKQRFHGNAPYCLLSIESLPTVYIKSPGSTYVQSSAKCLASLPKSSRLPQKCHNCPRGETKNITFTSQVHHIQHSSKWGPNGQ